MPLPRPSARVRLIAAGAAVLIAAPLLLVRLAGTNPMAVRLDSLRARGLPASVADLERRIPEAPAASRNAVLDATGALSRAFGGVNSADLDVLASKPARDWTTTDREVAAAAAPVLSGPTADLHASLSDGPVALGWASDPRTGRERYNIFDLIVAQQALALQVRAALAAGDIRSAARHSTDQLRLCRSQRPTGLVALIGRLATESNALACLGEIAGAAPADPAPLPALLRESGDLFSPELEAEAWICERLTILGLWNSVPQLLPPVATGTRRLPEAAADLVYRVGGRDRRDRIAYFDFMDGLIEAAGRQGTGRVAAIARLAPPPPPRSFLGLTQPILAMVIPSPQGLLRDSDSIRFRAEAARTALTVAHWRSRHGRWPTSLEEVFQGPGSARHPVDPGTDAPLRWEATDTGFRIVREGGGGGPPGDGDDGRSFAIPETAAPLPRP